MCSRAISATKWTAGCVICSKEDLLEWHHRIQVTYRWFHIFFLSGFWLRGATILLSWPSSFGALQLGTELPECSRYASACGFFKGVPFFHIVAKVCTIYFYAQKSKQRMVSSLLRGVLDRVRPRICLLSLLPLIAVNFIVYLYI